MKNHVLTAFAGFALFASLAHSTTETKSNSLYGRPLQDPNGRPCPPQGGENGDGGLKNSDPIDLSTGGYQLRQTDLFIPGRGIDFEIKRTYRSFGGLQAFVLGANIPDDPAPGNTRAGNRDLIDVLNESPMGHHWDFNYNIRVSVPLPEFETVDPQPESPDPVEYELRPDYIDVVTGDGRGVFFEEYSPGGGGRAGVSEAYYSNDHYFWRVSYLDASSPIKITTKSLNVYEFFPAYSGGSSGGMSRLPYAGRLNTITDRNGNQIQFFWETTSNSYERIDYAVDTLGRHIEFTYHDELHNGQASAISGSTFGTYENPDTLIWVIEDDSGRAYKYNYSLAGNGAALTSVTMPEIKSDSDYPLPTEHERFPSGSSWEFEYDDAVNWDSSTDLGPWFRGRMLTKVTSPNGDVVTENEYEYIENGDGSNFDRNDDRVKRQHYGDTTYCYIVTDMDGSIDLPRFGDVSYDYYVWVNDRRGAVTRFKYAGQNSALGFHRQLIEKVEYDGFIPANYKDFQVWADLSGSNPVWKYLDDSGPGDPIEKVFSGPVLPGGGQPTKTWTRSWETNSNWEIAKEVFPGPSGYHQQDRWRAEPGVGGGSLTDDPLKWGAIEKSIHSDGTDTIIEEWRYDYAHTGSGGCGCGSSEFATAHMDGNGNVTLRHFDPANGNLLAIYHDMPSSYFTSQVPPSSSNDAAAIENFAYNSHGQVVMHVHPETVVLDDSGNEVTHRRVDRYEYYDNQFTDGVNYGRIHRMIIDAIPDTPNGSLTYKQLVTEYEYDAAGNIIKKTRPGGDVSDFLYNQRSQLVREQHFDSTGTKLYAQIEYFYDANGNLVREEVMNRTADANGDPELDTSNASITTVYEYDIHDFRTVVSREAGVFGGTVSETDTRSRRAEAQITNAAFVSQRFTRDAAKNITKVEGGEAVAQNQASNVVDLEYDVRDQMIKASYGLGGMAPLVVEYDYDDRGRPEARHINSSSSTGDDQHIYVDYDTFDRVIKVVDAMGNDIFLEYDDNGNILSIELCGLVDDDAGSGTNVRLAKSSRVYDARDRVESEATEIFSYDYTTGSSVACQWAGALPVETVKFQYNDDSSVYRVERLTDAGVWDNVTTLYNDTAGREEFIFDALGGTVYNEYDADSNITKVSITDFSTSDPMLFEMFEESFVYDPLDRVIMSIDGVGNSASYKYDSRSNMIAETDARGNTTSYGFDALSRMTSMVQSLGSGNTITELSFYDASSRLIEMRDGNNNATEYVYDGLGRAIKVTMPDGTFYSLEYDQSGNPVKYTDARGVVVDQDFDRKNRVIEREVSQNGTAIGGSQRETFTYDSLGRLRKAWNDFARVDREYDSRSNLIREIQNADYANGFPMSSDREILYGFDDASNNSSITYPNGRVVYQAYDDLNRLSGIFNSLNGQTYSDPITEFEYIGRRLESRINGNSTRTDYAYNGVSDGNGDVNNAMGDFGFSRLTSITTTNTTTTSVLDAFTFTWDQSQNRTGYDDIGSGMKNRRERTFGYDAIDRLISTDVDFPDPNTDFTSPTNNGITTYTFDSVHNRTAVGGFEGVGAPIGVYSQTGTQADLNQYSLTPREAGSEWAYFYDANGNLVERVQNSPADYNGDYTVNGFDASAFNTAYNNGDPEADYNGDGQINFFDVSAFMQDYQQDENTDLEHWHYSYDFRNQLLEVTSGFGTATPTGTTNSYDALSRRVLETSIAHSKQLVYGGVSQWEVLQQIDLSQYPESVLTTHVFGIGIDDEVAYWIEDLETPEMKWAHRDDLGSLTSITDENGNVKERYGYGDYGRVTVYNASGAELPQGTQYYATHLYTGRMQVGGSGLYDLRHRMLDPETGRFIQRDPAGYFDSMNLYVYAMTNPLGFIDPYGLWSLYKWVLTGDGNASDEITDEAYNTFSETVNDRVNGIGDSLGVDSLSDNLGGTDHTFDPNERAKGECWANCIKDRGKDAVVDGLVDNFTGPLAPFLDVGVDGGGPSVNIGVPSLIDGVQGGAYGIGGAVKGIGTNTLLTGWGIEGTQRARGTSRHVKKARRAQRSGRAMRKAGKGIKGIGHLATAIEAYQIMKECAEECEACPNAY